MFPLLFAAFLIPSFHMLSSYLHVSFSLICGGFHFFKIDKFRDKAPSTSAKYFFFKKMGKTPKGVQDTLNNLATMFLVKSQKFKFNESIYGFL